jgi:hypothetical protein
MDFGGSFEAQFQAEYDAGMRSAAPALAEPAPPAQPAASPANSAPASGGELAGNAGLAAPHMPLCTEPWKSLYVLRRGVFPCCYGGAALAPMDQAAGAWNSDTMQEIRATLSAGRFPSYCLDSPSCPIVRKSEQARQLSTIDSLRLRSRHAASRADLAWQRVRWAGQWARIRLTRIVSDPAYVRFHLGKAARRLFGPR